MSYKFGASSRKNFLTLHQDLQRVFAAAIKVRDFSIIEGHRGEETQNHYNDTGKSQVRWPNSKHNSFPSLAADAIPYPFKSIDWENREKFVEWSAWMVGFAAGMGIALRSGTDWDGDHDLRDHNLFDGPHFELIVK